MVRFFIVVILEITVWSNFCNNLEAGEDLYSSITALNYVLNTEKLLIGNYENYVIRSEENLSFLKKVLSFIEHFREQQVKNINFRLTVENSFENFFQKRKFSVDFPIFQNNFNLLRENTIKKFAKIAAANSYPSDTDLNGVTMGILRIQEVFNISADQIANNAIHEIDLNKKLHGSHCLEIAMKLSLLDFHYYAIDWYKIALKRINEEGWKSIIPKIDTITIIDLLTQSQYKEGSVENIRDAIEILSKASKDNFNNKYGIHFETNLKNFTEHYLQLKSVVNDPVPIKEPLCVLNRENLTELILLKRACRGAINKTSSEERKLFCKYENKNHPFLLIAPIKVEIKNFSPYLVIFHDVIYDSEIEIFKKLSKDKLTRAQVWNPSTGEGEISPFRTSKFFWIFNKTHPLTHVLNQRLSDMTGLTMETAEEFQLMNYGIGGHYDLHGDSLNEPSSENDYQPFTNYEWGNRIATVLFYLSDVLHGGSTVWPFINVTAYPKKGTAAFWYNLRHDGQHDTRAQHAACPVIVGSKWVMNKWIRSNGQMFRKPCNKMQY